MDPTDAGDIFGRVEANKIWTTCEQYIEALESRPLGPNVAAFIGHSDMRAATMGLDRATRKDVRLPRPNRSRWSAGSTRH